MFQNGGVQSEHALVNEESCQILLLNEGQDLEDFSDSGSEENIVDSGKEFVPVDLEADLSDSNNGIFIFIIGIQATSRIKNKIKTTTTVFGQFLLCCCNTERYVI